MSLLLLLRPAAGPTTGVAAFTGDGALSASGTPRPVQGATLTGSGTLTAVAPVTSTDNFNRANGALGVNWVTSGAGPASISGNQVVGGTAHTVARYTTPATTGAMSSRITYRGGNGVGPAVAMSAFASAATLPNTGTFYALRIITGSAV